MTFYTTFSSDLSYIVFYCQCVTWSRRKSSYSLNEIKLINALFYVSSQQGDVTHQSLVDEIGQLLQCLVFVEFEAFCPENKTEIRQAPCSPSESRKI